MDIIALVFIGTLSRLAPHAPNVTAVGALALFSGARLSGKKALFITLATMFFSDVVLGFHSAMWATYGSMMLAVWLGTFLRSGAGVKNVACITFFSSVVFYLVTNFAVWLSGGLYPHTFSGLTDSYFMALPFLEILS